MILGGGDGGTMRVWRRKTHDYIERFKNLKGKGNW
jgi:hypothetical protein